MSKDFFKVKKGLNLDPTSSASIASPEVGDIIVDSSDNNKLKRYDDVTASWKDVGSGVGGINYISANSDFEGGTVGYARYANAAATEIPETGTGGSPNAAFTFTATTVSPLRGTKSGLITKDANSRLGHGVSYDFSIDPADQAQVLRISFDYNTEVTTTNYVDGDIRVYVYDVTNSRLIEVIDRDLYASAQGKFVGTFQTSPDSLSYRLIFHIAGTGTTAWTVELDNVIVGPQTIVKGAIVTDWEAFTPNFSNNTNVTYTGYKRRVGSDLEMNVLATYTGAGASVSLTMTLPDGLSIDDNKFVQNVDGAHLISSNGTFFDSSAVSTANVYLMGAMRLTSPSGFRITVFTTDDWKQFNPATVPVATAAGDSFVLTLKVPIQGWSSNVVLSEDAGNREIVGNLLTTTSQDLVNNTLTKLDFLSSDIVDDTCAFFSSADDGFIIPESGFYDISAYAQFANNATGFRDLRILVDNLSSTSGGATIVPAVSGTSTNINVNLTGVRLLKGQIVNLQARQTSGGNLIVSQKELSVAKRSSPQTLAASESVYLFADSSAATAIGTGDTTVIYANKVEDTHNAYNASTGIFTVPQSGIYTISTTVTTGSVAFAGNQRFRVNLNATGVPAYTFQSYPVDGSGVATAKVGGGTITRYFSKGTEIKIVCASSVAVNFNPSNVNCWISIIKA